MFCTRCGQQQFSKGVRFCSGCGVQLTGVSQFLEPVGMNFIQPAYPKERLPLIKRPELRKGANIIFLSFFSVVPSFILAIIIDHGLPLVIPFITFLVGLAQILYYFLFGESILKLKKQEQSYAYNEYPHHYNYQSAQSLPFESRSFNTSEFVHPPSITEPTANLSGNK